MIHQQNMRQMVFVPHYHRDGECLIGNSNTGRLHSLDCSAIDMMREDHKIPTDGAGFTPCGWCHACGTTHQDIFQEANEDPEGTELCMDKRIIQLFKQTGCATCSSKKGIIKMFPDPHGVRLIGKQGHWWIYFECEECGYQTAWWKAINKLKNSK